MKMTALSAAAAMLATAMLATTASAQVLTDTHLQITEMWAGGLPGTEATSDWFEVTNFGTSAATGLDGTLFYDDNSDDPEVNDPLTGIDSIAPGESVIYIVSWEDDFTEQEALDAFAAMWGGPAGDLTGVQIGVVQGGSGLGGGGDAANIFDGNTAGATTLDRAEYGSLGTNFASFVTTDGFDFPFPSVASTPNYPGAYQGNLAATDEIANLAVGSPGTFTVVPEPATLGLAGLALLGACGLRNRRR